MQSNAVHNKSSTQRVLCYVKLRAYNVVCYREGARSLRCIHIQHFNNYTAHASATAAAATATLLQLLLLLLILYRQKLSSTR
jgi:hypothetical protein